MNKSSALAASLIWLAATLLWWAFAFAPLSGHTTEWIDAARYACFGRLPNGLPQPYGWLGLVLSPISLLIALLLIFDPRVVLGSLLSFFKGKFGRGVFVLILSIVFVESFWVTQKFREAYKISQISFDATRPDTDLPEGYPLTDKPLPSFELIDQNGNKITQKTYLGRPVVLTFAFAHCTTVCPVLVHQVLKSVSAGDGVEILVITLDPWRDKPSVLKAIAEDWELPEYAHVLSSNSVKKVTTLFDAFNIPWSRNEQNGDITHPALVFVIHPSGQLAYTFNNPHPLWLKQALERVKKDYAARVGASTR